jgi:uncharacterized protein (DUF1499 family)
MTIGDRRVARRMRLAALLLLPAFAAAGFGLRLYMERPVEDRLLPAEGTPIAALRGKLPANAALTCPPGYCAVAGAMASPVFPVASDRLYRDFARLVAQAPRTVTVLAEEPRRMVVIQRSAVFGFPDIVTAEFVALGRRRSSLALFSRARYGRWDFAVNRRRVARWLARLAAAARQ